MDTTYRITTMDGLNIENILSLSQAYAIVRSLGLTGYNISVVK